MNCPKCGQQIEAEKLDDGGISFSCKLCGWGRDRDTGRISEGPPDDASHGQVIPWTSRIKLILFWTISLAICAGPYFMIVFGLPGLIGHFAPGIQSNATPDKLADSLTPGYWIFLATYLGLASIFSPKCDTENLGMFGIPWLNNPFTYQDNVNRSLLLIVILLAPGHFFWFTARGTVGLIKRAVSG